MGRMESTFQSLLQLQPLWNKFKKAESKDQFTGLSFEEHIANAIETGFISTAEAESLLQYNAKRYDSMLTDIFDEHLVDDLSLENPHLRT
jgi:acyl-CoA dehydrogenase